MYGRIVPHGKSFEALVCFAEHDGCIFEIGFALFVDEERGFICRQRGEKVEHTGDLRELCDALLQDFRKLVPRHFSVAENLTVVGHGGLGKVLRRHRLDVFAVEPRQLVIVKDGRRLADAAHIKRLFQLGKGKDLPVVLGTPAEQRDIVDDRLRQIALVDQIIKAGGAVALAQLGDVAVRVLAHDQGQVDVGRNLPAEGFIEEVVFGRGAQILAAAHHMGDAHGVVVDDVRKIVGGIAVGLDEDLILQLAVLHRDVAEHRVRKGRAALGRHLLTDDIGNALSKLLLNLLLRQIAAMAVVAAADSLGLQLFEPLLGAEAAVRLALSDQLFGIGQIHLLALRLHIGTKIAADVGTLVVLQACQLHGMINNVHRAVNQPFAVGVLNSQNEFAALRLRHQILIQRRAQIAHVHKAGGTGRITGADCFVTHIATSNKSCYP